MTSTKKFSAILTPHWLISLLQNCFRTLILKELHTSDPATIFHFMNLTNQMLHLTYKHLTVFPFPIGIHWSTLQRPGKSVYNIRTVWLGWHFFVRTAFFLMAKWF